jgi:5-methylcytosine-specific restriction endonuclease McrA
MASEATYVAKEAERQGRSMARVAELAARKAEREAKRQEWLNRPIEHGTTLTEYRRCLKRPEGSCDECKAIAAACAVGYRARNVERIRERERLWAQANPEKVRDMNRRQKTRRERKGRENGYEPYTRQKILERDNYLCWICGEPVDLSAPHQVGEPGWEMYPHLDHVIPLSKGGPDTPANVRTAHARCNMDKGAKVVGVAAD